MLLGPVFRAELVRTARRRRYYVLRTVYGLALLLLVWVSYVELYRTALRRGGMPSIHDTADFAVNTFVAFAVLQLATLAGLVPALFGGVIADEKQRKTMHYLMASRLSSGEIVVDKLLARLLHVGVFLLLGLPIMSLLSLFGGVPWQYVAVAYSGTASIILFAATLSTLVSTLARRVRQGVLIAYVLLVGWLVVPALADAFVAFVFPQTYGWFGPANEWVLATNPFKLVGSWRSNVSARFVRRAVVGQMLDPFLWMVGLQLALSVLFLMLAIWQLRPTYRRQEAGSRRLTWFSPARGRPRWLRRPDCGIDAMLWKERYFARTDLLTKLVVLPATILLTVSLALFGTLDERVTRAARDVWQVGYSAQSAPQAQLNTHLRMIAPIYLALWLLAVAGASASSLTVEREEDSWVSLVSTPLSGWEILRGKMVGAIWGLRGFAGLLSLIWLLALALGALHPLGLVLSILVAGMLTVSVAALGVCSSLTARSTSRAMTRTLVVLIILNGGYLVALIPLVKALSVSVREETLLMGCTPLLASLALISYQDVANFGAIWDGTKPLSPMGWRYFVVASLILSAYVVTAAALLRQAVRRFDKVVDRPHQGQAPRLVPRRPPVSRPAVSAAADRPVR